MNQFKVFTIKKGLQEENTKIAYKYSVFSMPVFLLFIEGKESIRTGRHVDLLSLERSIDRYYNMIY